MKKETIFKSDCPEHGIVEVGRFVPDTPSGGGELGSASSSIEVTALPSPWMCPRCNKVNAPWVNQCPCPAIKKYDPRPWPYAPFPPPYVPPQPIQTDPVAQPWPYTVDPLPDEAPCTGDPLPPDHNGVDTNIDITASVVSPNIDLKVADNWWSEDGRWLEGRQS